MTRSGSSMSSTHKPAPPPASAPAHVQQAAEQLALAALAQASSIASSLSAEMAPSLHCTELRQLLAASSHSVGELVTAVNANTAALKAAARFQALQNAIAIHDKAPACPTGSRRLASESGCGYDCYEEVGEAQARALLRDILFTFLRGSSSYTFSAQYSTHALQGTLWHGRGRADFEAGRKAFVAAVAQRVELLTGMRVCSGEGKDGVYTLTLLP